ncbi:DUF3142 domain-containing protein [Pontiella agarivorans]|uniref:DUF3142 domain-containing protein n=1 Tax=Pontiella agarivorans TaxID=3038953 RepID=A0ABU5MUK1_9BACT|nr:DUF3142 domain-containing protein [Pontiella agarivorans]MDZ8117904.1 DUF3142 domain-containing protein [Pontiella agarivorans]
MKPILLPLAILALTSAAAAKDAFYIWQQHWNSNVVHAVTRESPTTFYPIVTEIPAAGQSPLIPVPWAQLKQTGHTFIPVIRVPLSAFNRSDLDTELLRLCTELSDFHELQFDLDCPESRLSEYADLLKKIRSHLTGTALSVTALPAHLGNRDFERVALNCDYYVLQVHGLDVPDHIHRQAELMNFATAEQAVRRAEKLGHPYAIALPCYAYELNFDPDTGRFLHLTAEGPAGKRSTIKRRIAARPRDLIRLIQQFPSLQHARNLIWFRLPVPGDRLCLPRPALTEIQHGSIPQNKLTCTCIPISATTFEIGLLNGNVIHAHEAELTLTWNNPRGMYDLYRTVTSPEKQAGQLPATLQVPVPAPGSQIKVGWFSAEQFPLIEVHLK